MRTLGLTWNRDSRIKPQKHEPLKILEGVWAPVIKDTEIIVAFGGPEWYVKEQCKRLDSVGDVLAYFRQNGLGEQYLDTIREVLG